MNHHELKVGIDTTPLLQTRAGTARHVAGLLQALRGRPELELVGLSAEGSGRLATVRRDALWYPLRLGRASVGLDVLHCTTFRAPVSARAPLVVTVHDLALLRHPSAFPRWHRTTGAMALRGGVRAADAVVAVSAFTRDELVALLGVPVERIRVVHAWFLPSLAIGVHAEIAAQTDEMDAAAQARIDRVLAAAGPPPEGVELVSEPVRGTPGFALIEESRDADLVVLGSRGPGGFTELLLGSTTAEVAAHSHCPVGVVR